MNLIVPRRALADNFFCFTTTREGGVSGVPYDSFNLAEHVSDVHQHVSDNRRTLLNILINHSLQTNKYLSKDLLRLNTDYVKEPCSVSELAPLRFLKQTHSSGCTHYRDITNNQTAADAVFSDQSKLPLAVLTADCLPIVLCSSVGNQYAAVHAGWKGLIGGVLENTIGEFTGCKSNISAWIGPSICQMHFEVGSEVASQFSRYKFAVVDGTSFDKRHIDLSAVAAQILRQLGIEDVQQSRVCTYCRDDLFSFRQATHNGFKECGRMATVAIKY